MKLNNIPLAAHQNPLLQSRLSGQDVLTQTKTSYWLTCYYWVNRLGQINETEELSSGAKLHFGTLQNQVTIVIFNIRQAKVLARYR